MWKCVDKCQKVWKSAKAILPFSCCPFSFSLRSNQKGEIETEERWKREPSQIFDRREASKPCSSPWLSPPFILLSLYISIYLSLSLSLSIYLSLSSSRSLFLSFSLLYFFSLALFLSGPEKGVITKGVFWLEECLDSLKSQILQNL